MRFLLLFHNSSEILFISRILFPYSVSFSLFLLPSFCFFRVFFNLHFFSPFLFLTFLPFPGYSLVFCVINKTMSTVASNTSAMELQFVQSQCCDFGHREPFVTHRKIDVTGLIGLNFSSYTRLRIPIIVALLAVSIFCVVVDAVPRIGYLAISVAMAGSWNEARKTLTLWQWSR